MVKTFETALIVELPAFSPEILQLPTFSPLTLPAAIEQIFAVEVFHLITSALLVLVGNLMVFPTRTEVATELMV